MNYQDLEVNEFYVCKGNVLMYIGEDSKHDNKAIFKVVLKDPDSIMFGLALYDKNTGNLRMLKYGLMMNSLKKLESK